jgi:phosphohistidine phosphatase
LYLVQHGLARTKDQDPDRPLTAAGGEDVRKVAAYVGEKTDVQVSRILHSGKTRARQTAEILAEFLKPGSGVEAVQSLDPMDDPVLWAQQLADTDEDLMLVGHLPHLSKLAALLICGDPQSKVVDFRNGGVVSLRIEDEGHWALQWILLPEMV